MDNHFEDDAPPPYSAVDPLQSQVANNNNNNNNNDNNRREEIQASNNLTANNSSSQQLETPSSAIPLHGGDDTPLSSTILTPPATTESPSPRPESSSTPQQQPAHFASAAGYFAERGLPSLSPGDEKRDTLVHHLTIYARSQGKDFPRRPRCWNARAAEINQHDWDTFLNFAFPSALGPAASSTRLHRRVRAEIERDRKDRPQETDDERRARLDAVINEWNEYFFNPRGTYITWAYIADLEIGPVSPLCPNCYPQATEASENRLRLTRTPSFDAPIPVSSESPVHRIPRRPVPLTDSSNTSAQQNQRSSVAVSPISATGVTVGRGLDHRSPQMPFARSYHHNPYQSANYNSWASNPVAWATQMSMRAQQYAEKISAQAQEYGRSIEESALQRSRQMEQYSKKLENNALAHGRRFEEAAISQGRKIEQVGDRISHWASEITRRSLWPVAQSPREKQRDSWKSESIDSINIQQPSPRRLSAVSNASSTGTIDSVSSIDSISTTSNLEPDDLAAVRAQLLSLDGYHDRELHSAAVGLRSHLRILQQTRRDSRFLLPRIGASTPQRGSWGRWDSPEEEKQREQRRVAIKEEAKLLREAFHETGSRAKREVRELKRARQTRKLQRNQQQQKPGVASPSPPLIDRTISNLESGFDKEVLSPPTSFNRTASDPVIPTDSRTAPRSAPAPAPAPAPSFSLNPHEAAKAWANAQRAKVKDIQKANKEKIKEIERAHKEYEKKQRKLAKKKGTQLQQQQTPGLIAAGLTRQVTPTAARSSSISSSSTTANSVSNQHLPRQASHNNSNSPQTAQETSTVQVHPDANAGGSSPWGAGLGQESGVTIPGPETHTFELEGDHDLTRR